MSGTIGQAYQSMVDHCRRKHWLTHSEMHHCPKKHRSVAPTGEIRNPAENIQCINHRSPSSQVVRFNHCSASLSEHVCPRASQASNVCPRASQATIAFTPPPPGWRFRLWVLNAAHAHLMQSMPLKGGHLHAMHGAEQMHVVPHIAMAVSYTHLTLPTILLV